MTFSPIKFFVYVVCVVLCSHSQILHAQEKLLAIGDGSTLVCILIEDLENSIGKWISGTDLQVVAKRKARRLAKRRRNRIRKKVVSAVRQDNDIAFVTFSEELRLWKKTVRDVARCANGEGLFANSSSSNPITTSSVPVCDVIGDSSRNSLRIINGSACSVGDSPIVSIEMFDVNGGNVGQCSGTVVAPRVVVTAAHCVEFGVAVAKVVTGFGSLRSSQIFHHPNYNSGGVFEANDVAVIKTGGVIPTRHVRMLKSSSISVGERGVIAGYGLDERSKFGVLRGASVKIADAYKQGIMITYSGKGSDGNTCSGDSGGPLLVERNGEWVLAGTTSWGLNQNCGPGDRSYFAHISDSLNWIGQVAPEAFLGD